MTSEKIEQARLQIIEGQIAASVGGRDGAGTRESRTPIDARMADTERLGDGRGPEALRLHLESPDRQPTLSAKCEDQELFPCGDVEKTTDNKILRCHSANAGTMTISRRRKPSLELLALGMRYSHESEVQMSTTPGLKRLFLADSLPLGPPNEETHIDSADMDQFTDVPTLDKRTWLSSAYFLIAVGIGVAATLTWQSYNDAIRGTIAPVAALKAISADLRITNNVATSQEQTIRSVDQLAAHTTTGLEQITREIAALRTVEQQTFNRVMEPLRPSRASTALTPAKSP
jgi:hypothetical protein